MPGSQDLIQIIDSSLTKTEITDVIAALQPLKEEVKAFANIAIFTKNTSGAKEFREQAELLTATMEKLKSVESQLASLKEKSATASKVRTDQEIADTQRQQQATRGRVAAIRSEEDAYKLLTYQARVAREEFQRLAAQYGVNSKEAKAAGVASKELSEQVQKIAKAGGDARTGVGRYTEGIKDFVKEAAAMFGAVILIQKAFGFIKDSIKAFMDAEQSTSRLNNILSNLGRQDVFESLNKEAKELSETLGTVAEKDVTETFQKLVTYGKLTKSQILELTPVIADFAAKQRIDMPEATSAITKALEGNARSLKEYGINIKDGKDATERFAIIMDQLKPRVDGAAKAFGDTLAGGMKKSEIAVEELKVKIGEEFAPVISNLEKSILEGVKGIPDLFSGISHGFDMIIEKGKIAALAFLKLASFGLNKGFDRYMEEQKQQAKILESSEKHNQAMMEAESFRKEASKKSISDQEHELSIQRALMNSDLARYNLLKAHGELSTKQGQQAIDYAFRSIAIVNALQKQLKDSKDTSILGFGKESGGSGSAQAVAKEILRGIAPDKNLVGRDFNDLNELANRAGGLHTGSVSGNINSHDDLTLSDKAQQNIDDLAAHKKRMHDYEMQFGDEAIKLSESLVKDGYEREINAIQKKIDMNNELHTKETKAIQSSTLSLQEKAAAQILLDSKVAANNEELKKKERDIKIKEAIFDKASTILQLEEQGAIAALAALKIPIYGEIEAIAIEGITQLQVAAVAAKTIPTYAKGTKHHPGGAMIVGEEGPELRLDPSGKVSLTPGVPTLTFAERGAQIFTNQDTKKIMSDHVNNQMLRQMYHSTANQIDNRKELNEIRDAINEGTMAQLSAMKKKQPIHNHIHIHASFENHIDNAVRN